MIKIWQDTQRGGGVPKGLSNFFSVSRFFRHKTRNIMHICNKWRRSDTLSSASAPFKISESATEDIER